MHGSVYLVIAAGAGLVAVGKAVILKETFRQVCSGFLNHLANHGIGVSCPPETMVDASKCACMLGPRLIKAHIPD